MYTWENSLENVWGSKTAFGTVFGFKTVFEIEQNHFPMFGLENTYAGILFTARLLFENSYL